MERPEDELLRTSEEMMREERDRVALACLTSILTTEAPGHYYEPKLAIKRAFDFADEFLRVSRKRKVE